MAIRDRGPNYFVDYEDTGFGGNAMEQNEALANIINPPAPSPAPASTPAPTKNISTTDATIEALKKQILGQGLTGKWTGQGYGSAEANAADMAKILAGIGITDIKQFGPITREVDAYIGSDDSGNPIYEKQTERTFGNKETGQAVPVTYSGRQTGNFFGGTYEGKGNTGYGVNFAPDGTPIFYTQGASSNDLANLMQDMGPVFQIGLALATGGLSIPQQIAARMAVNVLSGQDIGDAVKSAAISMAVANIPGTDLMKDGAKYIEKMGLDPTITKTLTNSFQNAVTSGATAALTGQDVSDAMLRGAATGGVNGAINALLNSADMKELTKDLSATQKRLVSNAVTGVISGKPLDQVLINSAIAAASAEAKEQAKYKPLSNEDYQALGPDQRAKYDEGGTKALLDYNRTIKNLSSLTTSGRTGGDMGGDGGATNTSTSPDPAELIIAAQQKADAEAAARLAEQERLARETADAAARAREEANRLAAEAKNLQDAENARKAKEEADRLAKEADDARKAKEAEDARKAKEAELVIATQRKAEEEAAARLAEQERLAREVEDARKAKEAEDARKAGEAEAARLAELERIRQTEIENERQAEIARKAKEAEDARKAKEAEVLITTKRKADEEAARIAEQERLAREAQQVVKTPTSEPPNTLPSTPVIDAGAVKVTAPKAVPECPPGFVYDQDLKMCMPAESTGTLPSTLPSMGQVTITGKKETCPVGTVLNPITGECEPVVEDKGRMTIIGKRDPCPPGTVYDEVLDACVPIPTPPVTPPVTPPTPPTPTPPATKPTAAKPPAAATPLPTIPSFTPSGSYVTTETTDPIYAGKMGDFNLFSTLEELLASESGEKASTKPNVKTKMATGGHLDDLLVEQFSVDDLLKLLR